MTVQRPQAVALPPCFVFLPGPFPPPSPSLRPGSLTLTGQVGEVLEESARIALSWIRSNAYELGLEPFPRAVRAVHDVLPAAAHDLRLGTQPLHALRDASVLPTMQRDGDFRPHPEAVSALPGDPDTPASYHLGRLGGSAVVHNSAPAGELRIMSSSARGLIGAVGSLRGAPEGGAAPGSSASAGNPATSWDIHIHLPAGVL